MFSTWVNTFEWLIPDDIIENFTSRSFPHFSFSSFSLTDSPNRTQWTSVQVAAFRCEALTFDMSFGDPRYQRDTFSYGRIMRPCSVKILTLISTLDWKCSFSHSRSVPAIFVHYETGLLSASFNQVFRRNMWKVNHNFVWTWICHCHDLVQMRFESVKPPKAFASVLLELLSHPPETRAW